VTDPTATASSSAHAPSGAPRTEQVSLRLPSALVASLRARGGSLTAALLERLEPSSAPASAAIPGVPGELLADLDAYRVRLERSAGLPVSLETAHARALSHGLRDLSRPRRLPSRGAT